MGAVKGVSLRYLAARLRSSVDEMVNTLSSSSTATLPEAMAKGVEAYQKQLTGLIYFAGAAMAPTLNGKAETDAAAIERLLVRWLPRPTARSVHVGDVVALSSPLRQGELLVRRVAAAEGEELACDDADEAPRRVPPGHCWVLADNEKLGAGDVIDSRAFGPLALSSVLGRVLYYGRSATDHGAVENSDAAMAADAPVLAAELDAHREELLRGAGAGPTPGPADV